MNYFHQLCIKGFSALREHVWHTGQQEPPAQYVVLNVTRRCNMQCPHCLHRQYQPDFFSDDDMKLSHAREILRYFYQHGMRKLLLVAEGEMTLYPHVKEVARFARELGFIEIGTFTNGILLDRHIETVTEYFDFIYISVDGYNPETYAKHRGMDGVYDKIITNITTLVNAKEQSSRKLCIGLVCVVHEQNYLSIGKMIELAETLQVNRIEFFNFHATTSSYQGCVPLYAHNTDAIDYMHRIMASTDYSVEIMLPSLIGKKRTYFCSNLFGFIMIGVNGAFSPCNYIPTDDSYGNFFSDPEAYKKNMIHHYKDHFSGAKQLQELEFVCRECPALSPENDLFFPNMRMWRKRVLQDNITYVFEDQCVDARSETLHWTGDDIELFAPDIRLNAAEWYETEGTLRWSRPECELPFFLEEEARSILFYWSSMRAKTKVKITFFTADGNFSTVETVTNPDWHEIAIPFPKAVSGQFQAKFVIRKPFFAPNDPRELGMAFKIIRFLAS